MSNVNLSGSFKMTSLSDRKIFKIALLGEGFSSWGGGLDFLRLCANALSSVYESDNAKILILLPDPDKKNTIRKLGIILKPYRKFISDLILFKKPFFDRSKPFSRRQLIDSFQNIEGQCELIFYHPKDDKTMLLERVEADVVIPSSSILGSQFKFPWVGYLFDFQHKYYPQYFSKNDIAKRDKRFMHMLNEADAVIVNSADTKNDIYRFFPENSCKIFNLPFSANPIRSWFVENYSELKIKYNLPDKYFMICNQFWIHKDHGTAFKALSIYEKMTGFDDVHLVCTGNTIDSRHPFYFNELKQSNFCLKDRIHFLGHIPKKDQIGIMCEAIAVLQPTLFEGGPGGGAVYDAVAMGVPAVVSDIAVNKEIGDIDGIMYFKASDPEDMAKKMVLIQCIKRQKPCSEQLLSEGRERTRKLGMRLREAIEYAVSKKL